MRRSSPTEKIQYVYLVEDGAARYVEVTTGLTGSGVTEVTSGLSAGQQLVTVGQAYLHDGDVVRIVEGEKAGAEEAAPADGAAPAVSGGEG